MYAAATRFVIVNNGRSGSTLLVDLLCSHPDIQCEAEILNEHLWRSWRRPLLWLIRANPLPYLEQRAGRATRPSYGFKLKTGGQVDNLGRTLRCLHHHGWRMIYLHRRDALQQTLSWSVAQASGCWQTTAADRPRAPHNVTLDVGDFMRNLRTCVADQRILADLMRHLPHLPLVYEDDLQSSEQWPSASAQVCAWLGVSPAPLASQVVKTWERPYAEVVTNCTEILAAVARSPFDYLTMSSDNTALADSEGIGA